MTTSSYISPLMLSLDAEAKAKGLIVLNECGLDPGIDILGTMKVVHEAKEAGHKVVSYESYCGGIPTAEQADNPLGYKFSWNPGASIKASKNTSIFMKDGKRVVTNEPLKHTVDCPDVSVAMKLEAYPNRDSTVFMDRFGMSDCHTFIRGTYRFTGFAGVSSIKLNLLTPVRVKILSLIICFVLNVFRLFQASMTLVSHQMISLKMEYATSENSAPGASQRLLRKHFLATL